MQIKYFRSNLVPMEIPVFEGVETLNTIGDSAYPLFARPHIDGVHAMIRHGHFHFLKGDTHFSNLSVKSKFASLLDFARVNHYSMHCTFKSDMVDDEVLTDMLSRFDVITPEEDALTNEVGGNMFTCSDVLPGDLKIYITDVVIDAYAEKMNIDSRTANLWFINKEMASECIEVLVPEYCVDNDHLDIKLEDLRRQRSLHDGVVLYSDGSIYTPGDSYASAGAVIIRLVEEEELDVLDLVQEGRYIMKRSSECGNFTVLDAYGSIHAVCLSKLSDNAYDSFMSKNDLSTGSKITATRVNLRTMQTPEYLSIKTFEYACQSKAA